MGLKEELLSEKQQKSALAKQLLSLQLGTNEASTRQACVPVYLVINARSRRGRRSAPLSSSSSHWLQPLLHTGTASVTYGCSLRYIRLQAQRAFELEQQALASSDALGQLEQRGAQQHGELKQARSLVITPSSAGRSSTASSSRHVP